LSSSQLDYNKKKPRWKYEKVLRCQLKKFAFKGNVVVHILWKGEKLEKPLDTNYIIFILRLI